MKRNGMILLLTLATGLAACGGGSGSNMVGAPSSSGSNTPQAVLTTASSSTGLVGMGSATTSNSTGLTTAEGIWRGSTDTSRTFTSLITDNGFYWMLYSVAGNANQLAGVVIGNSMSSNNSVTGITGKDFNFETNSFLPLTWKGSYNPGNRLQGTLSYTSIPSGIVNFSADYNATYGLAPSVAGIAGTYSGSSTSLARGSLNTSLSIQTNGQISGSRADGCTFTGALTPRNRGNAYSLSLAYTGGNCPDRNAYSNGTAFFNQGNKQLYTASLLYSHTLSNIINDGKDVFVFMGNRP